MILSIKRRFLLVLDLKHDDDGQLDLEEKTVEEPEHRRQLGKLVCCIPDYSLWSA